MKNESRLLGSGNNDGSRHTEYAAHHSAARREITVDELFRIIRRRRFGILVLMGASLVLTMLVYVLQKPEYHAVSVVMIKDDKRPSDLLQAVLGPDASVDMNASKKDIALIKSMPIAELTIKELERSRNGKALEIFGNKTYQSPVIALVSHIVPFKVGNAGPRKDRSPEEILRRRALLLTKRIRVTPVKDTNMLKVSVASPFSNEAELLTNTLCSVYREADIERNSEKYAQANSFIAKSLVDQKQKLDEADRSLSGYMSRNEIYEVSGNTQQLLNKMVDSDAQYNAVQAEYHTVANTLNFLEKKLSESDKAISSQIEQTVNSQLSSIMDKIHGLENSYVALLKQKGSDEPAVKAKKQELDEVKARYEKLQRSSIAGEIGYAGRARKFGFDMVSEKLQIERKLNELKFRAGEFARIRQYYESQLSNLPYKQQAYLKLERDRNVASKTYEELKQKFDETRIFLGSEVGGVSIIGSAFRPFTPEKPSLPVNLLLGVLFGGLLAIGYTYIEESVDGTLQDDFFFDEIGVRPLAYIPTVGPYGYPALPGYGKGKLMESTGRTIRKLLPGSSEGDGENSVTVTVLPAPLICDNLDSPFAESIRMLRTSIQYSIPGKPPQSILISGTAMWEGKSTVCVNLGMAYALVGKKTLIIDCDLRRPSQHIKLNCQRGPGLTDFLNSENDEFSAPHIQTTQVDNLFLLSAGAKVSGPSELLASDDMQRLLAVMKTRFDCILLDCSPFFLSDASQLADWVDGIVMVSRLQYTGRKMLQNIISDPYLKARLLGVALISTTEMSKQGYYGKYGYAEYEEESQLLS